MAQELASMGIPEVKKTKKKTTEKKQQLLKSN